MVKIPRYEGSLGARPIRSGRTLGTGISAATSFTKFGQSISDSLIEYNNTQIELLARARDVEIKNAELLAASATRESNLNAIDSFQTETDYKSFDGKYKERVERNNKRIQKNFFTLPNGKLDEISYNSYLANQGNLLYVDGLQQVKTLSNQKRYNESVLAVSKTTEDSINNVIKKSNLSSSAVQSQYNEGILAIDDYNGILEPDIIIAQKEQLYNSTNESFIYSQTTEIGKIPVTKNQSGETVADYIKINEYLTNKSNYEGDNRLTNIDGTPISYRSPEADSLIERVQNQLQNEIFFDNQTTNNKLNSIWQNNELINGNLSEAEIDQQDWPDNEIGRSNKTAALEIRLNRISGESPTEPDILMRQDIIASAYTFKIQTTHQKEYFPNSEKLQTYLLTQLKIKYGKENGQTKYNNYKEKKMSVFDLQIEGFLDPTSATNIRSIVNDPELARMFEIFENSKNSVIPQIRGNDVLADQDNLTAARLYKFEYDAEQEFIKKVFEEGVKADDLLNPASSDYIFKEEFINQYKISQTEQINNVIESYDINLNSNKIDKSGAPQWDDFKDKYETYDDFIAGDEIKKFEAENNIVAMIQEETDRVITYTELTSSNNVKYKVYDDNTVDPAPKQFIYNSNVGGFRGSNYSSNPLYVEWQNTFSLTHKKDGAMKEGQELLFESIKDKLQGLQNAN